MKFLNILLCLFLVHANAVPSSYEDRLAQFEKMVGHVSKEQAFQISKEMSEFSQKIERKRASSTKKKKTYQNLQKESLLRKPVIERKIERQEKNESKFWPWKRAFARQKKRNYEILKSSLKEQLRQNERILHVNQRKILEYDGILERIAACQLVLGHRFSSELILKEPTKEMKKDRILQGQQGLPAYGSMTATMQKSQISCPLTGEYSIDDSSDSWIPFLRNAMMSAGTWTYPNGGLHLGMDLASALYSPIYAAANGIVLYADAPVDSNCGYLGNYCGWPYGGGNTICTIMSVQDKLYAVSLCHLSNQIFVYPGQQFHQGDILAHSGNSGNSTGPHTHIEVFELRVSLDTTVRYFQKNADFSFGCGWSQPSTCSDIACRIRPEEIL